MTVLVDTGVLYADHDTDATRHDVASEALEAVFDGEVGQPYASDYVFDDAVPMGGDGQETHEVAGHERDPMLSGDG